MKQHNCTNCGAQLTNVTPGESVTCSHCDSTFVVPTGSGAAKVLIIGIGLFTVVGILGATLTGMLAAGGVATIAAVESAHTPTVKKGPVSRPKAPLPISKLKELEGFFGYRPLDAPGRIGAFTAIDPVANIPWMTGIARAWTADVRLSRLDLSGVRADGVLDVSARDDFELRARFASPTLRKSSLEMAKVSETKIKSEFVIVIAESVTQGRVAEESQRDKEEAVPPPPTFGCSLSELVASFKANGLESRPYYDLTLQWIDPNRHRKGYWRWIAGSIKPGESIKGPNLDPATCKPR